MSVLGLVGGNPFIALLAALTAANKKKPGSKEKQDDGKIKRNQDNSSRKHLDHKDLNINDKNKDKDKDKDKGKEVHEEREKPKDKKKEKPIQDIASKVNKDLKHDQKTSNKVKDADKSNSHKKDKAENKLEDILNLKIEDIEKCEGMDLQLIGKKLIISGALLQEYLAELVKAEADQINKTVKKLRKDENKVVTINDLHKVNKSISETICCIAEIEDKIIEKIRLGEKLFRENTPVQPDKVISDNKSAGKAGCKTEADYQVIDDDD